MNILLITYVALSFLFARALPTSENSCEPNLTPISNANDFRSVEDFKVFRQSQSFMARRKIVLNFSALTHEHFFRDAFSKEERLALLEDADIAQYKLRYLWSFVIRNEPELIETYVQDVTPDQIANKLEELLQDPVSFNYNERFVREEFLPKIAAQRSTTDRKKILSSLLDKKDFYPRSFAIISKDLLDYEQFADFLARCDFHKTMKAIKTLYNSDHRQLFSLIDQMDLQSRLRVLSELLTNKSDFPGRFLFNWSEAQSWPFEIREILWNMGLFSNADDGRYHSFADPKEDMYHRLSYLSQGLSKMFTEEEVIALGYPKTDLEQKIYVRYLDTHPHLAAKVPDEALINSNLDSYNLEKYFPQDVAAARSYEVKTFLATHSRHYLRNVFDKNELRQFALEQANSSLNWQRGTRLDQILIRLLHLDEALLDKTLTEVPPQSLLELLELPHKYSSLDYNWPDDLVFRMILKVHEAYPNSHSFLFTYKTTLRDHAPSLLHLATKSPRAIQYVVDKGSDVDIRDGLGETPLQWATKKGWYKSVMTLLELGADPNGGSRLNLSAKCIAEQLKHKDSPAILEALKKAGATGKCP